MNWTDINTELPPAFMPILFVSVSRDGKAQVCYGQYENLFFEATEYIGITETNFSRWFRKPLTDEQENKITDAIKAIRERENI